MTREQIYEQQRDIGLPMKWMAPEARRATVQVCFKRYSKSFQSDIWSFAIVLYEIFSLGATPYEEQNTFEELQLFIENGGRCSKPEYCHPTM